MEPFVEASGLVILTRSRPQKLLLLQHVDRWDLPKGHLDCGEDIQTAALRETWEETGIPAGSIELDKSFRFIVEYPVRGTRRGEYQKRVTYLLGYVDTPIPIQVTEHIGYRWWDWPVNQSVQVQTIDPLLQRLAEYLDSSSSAHAH
jgi:8-oxo-dGTP pyrophosphatase MutT (NUDIX family)